MKDYYIFQHCNLDADEKVLRISGERKRRLPVEEIAGLHLLSGYTLTSGVIDLAAKNNIPIHAYNYYGIYHGTFFPPPVEPTGSILIDQVQSRLDEKRRLGFAYEALKPYVRGDSFDSQKVAPARLRGIETINGVAMIYTYV